MLAAQDWTSERAPTQETSILQAFSFTHRSVLSLILTSKGTTLAASFRLRDELLNGEIFYSLKEAQTIIESWRRRYNAVRPHGTLGYRPGI